MKIGDANRAIVCRRSLLVEPSSRFQIFLPFILCSLYGLSSKLYNAVRYIQNKKRKGIGTGQQLSVHQG